MDNLEKERLVNECVRYIEADTLPTPLPTNVGEYESWREGAHASPAKDDDAEEAWADLYRLVDEQPAVAWEIIRAVAARCRTDMEGSTLAAGPFENFIQKHGDEFRSRIEDELTRNDGFRMTYKWL